MARKGTVVGLDFGRHVVKAVWVTLRHGRPAVTRVETLSLPYDAGDAKAVLVPWLQKQGLRGQPCVLAIPGQQTMFQPFRLVPADPRTVEQAAAMEVIKFNEMASEQMVYSVQPFGLQDGDRRLFLSMARPSLLDDLLRLGRDLELDVIDIIPGPVALFNAFESQAADHAAPTMIMDVGRSATEIAIGVSGALLFARTFASGGQMFTDTLSSERSLPSVQAEKLKITEGSLVASSSTTFDVLGPAARLWYSEIESCMAVYSNLYADPAMKPTRVVLSGGGAELPGLSEFLAAQLGIEVVRADSTALGLPAGTEHAGTLATAVGLAVSALPDPPAGISLLPEDVRTELTFREQKPFWIAAGVVAALTLAVSYIGGYRYNERSEAILRKQNDSLTQRQRIAHQITQVRARNALMDSMAGDVTELLGSAPRMQQLVTLVATGTAAGDWITLIADAQYYFGSGAPKTAGKPAKNTTRTRPGYAPPAPGPDSKGIQRVMIEGYTRTSNHSTVKDLIAKLKEAPFVLSADLLGDDRVVEHPPYGEIWERPFAKRFVIEVRFEP